LASQQKPSFSGSDEASAMLVVIFRLRQLRFGQRPAFIRREHCTAPGHLADTPLLVISQMHL
jgi:hypothetical protein